MHVLFYRVLIFFFFFFFFFQIFHNFNWPFYASIPWKCICSRYFVSATPPAVLYHSPLKLHRSFNYSLKICKCFLQNLEIIFLFIFFFFFFFYFFFFFFFFFTFFLFCRTCLLSHLLVAGCDIGVRFPALTSGYLGGKKFGHFAT